MSIYRVVVSYFHNHMQYMAERGAFAMTPGEALDNVLFNLQIDQTRINSLKTWVAKPEQLSEFDVDASIMTCVGSDLSVKDLWKRKHGD